MASTLIINPGSSSKKFSLFTDGRLVFCIRYERQEDMIEVCTTSATGERQKCEFVSEATYKNALVDVLKRATGLKAITRAQDITMVGVRLVVPGQLFQKHQIITSDLVATLRERAISAPLHIPPTLYEIEQVMIEMPDVPVVGVSDSAFHSSIPDSNRRYSIPDHDMQQFEIQRFGYHGISVSSVVRELPRIVGAVKRVIVCHVGSGISLTAVQDNQSIDTTMGYSPLSGMVMGTRAGDIDPGALLELMRVKQFSVNDIYKYLSTECGLKGLSGQADLRTLLQRASCGDEASEQALTILKNRFQKQLLGLMAALGGVDAIVFTGTAVERSSELRAHLLDGLDWLELAIDKNRNDEIVGGHGLISYPEAKVVVAVIKTSEEVEMLRIVHTFK